MARKRATSRPTLDVLRACPHHFRSDLGYMAASEQADQLLSEGVEQSQCPVCRLWFWPHEMGKVMAL